MSQVKQPIERGEPDPDLALIVDRWLNLPGHIKHAVLVLVKAAYVDLSCRG